MEGNVISMVIMGAVCVVVGVIMYSVADNIVATTVWNSSSASQIASNLVPVGLVSVMIGAIAWVTVFA